MRARLLATLLLALVCACQSDDDSNSYVDDVFAVWTMSFDQPPDADSSSFANQLEDQAAAWDELLPPDELQAEHDDLVNALYEAARAFRESSGQGDESLRTLVEVVDRLGDRYEAWSNEIANRYEVRFFRMEGSSMEPTLSDGDGMRVRLNPGDITRGELIYFTFHLNPERSFARRVIGLPGETVEVRDGAVFIDGERLMEEYILNEPNYRYGPREVPNDRYFVLGDNRRNSFDSHAWESQCLLPGSCDFVPDDNVIGVVRDVATDNSAQDNE